MITKSTYSKGLQDVVAGESSICFIDGKKCILAYRGYSIHDLVAHSNFEETAYLLLFGDMPNSKALTDFKTGIAKNRELPEPVTKVIRELPKDANPMAALRTAVSFMGIYDKDAESRTADARRGVVERLLARVPTAIAYFERSRKGLPLVAPKLDANVSSAANFLYMIRGKEATELEVKMLDQYLILLAEHDYNASTFTSRITGSTLSDLYSAIVSGIGTLKGDLHGSANTRAMESLLQIGDVSKVESFVEDALKNKKKIMGFGHRVYKGPDPRAKDLRNMAKALADGNKEQAKWFAISEKLEKTVWDRKKLYCNVDFYSASVLYTIGISVDIFTTLFAMSRVAGWSAHVLAQYADNRLIRPVSEYTGKTNQKYIPIAQR